MTVTASALLAAFTHVTRGDGGTVRADGTIVIPTTPGRTVIASQWGNRWTAIVGVGGPLSIGPVADAPLPDLVDWLREVCNALPDLEPETFVVGLPVVITVNGDGSIVVEVDLGEADDIESEHLDQDMLRRYAASIRSAILHGRVTTP